MCAESEKNSPNDWVTFINHDDPDTPYLDITRREKLQGSDNGVVTGVVDYEPLIAMLNYFSSLDGDGNIIGAMQKLVDISFAAGREYEHTQLTADSAE